MITRQSENVKKALLTIFLVVFYFALGQSALAAPTFNNVTGNTALPAGTMVVDGNKWIKAGDLTIPSGSTLQINSNSSLQFEPNYEIIVNGQIFTSVSNGLIKKGIVNCAEVGCCSGSACPANQYCETSNYACTALPVCKLKVEAGFGTTNVANNTQATGCDTTCQACQSGACGVANASTDPGDQCAISTQYTQGGDPNYCQQRTADGFCNSSGACNGYGSWSNINGSLVCSTIDHCSGNTYYSNYTCSAGACAGDSGNLGCCAGSACSAGNYCRASDHSCQPVPVCQVRNETGFGMTNVANNTQVAGCNGTCQACQSGACGVASAGTACGSSTVTSCSGADTCNASGACLANDFSSAIDCGICAKCNGSGSCAYDSTQNADCAFCQKCEALTVCGNQTDEDLKIECAASDTCSGSCAATAVSGLCNGGACAAGVTTACAAGSYCSSGVCSGTDTCAGFSDICDQTGAYSTCGGACSRNTDGNLCDDGNVCTTGEACGGGGCSGGSPVICNPVGGCAMTCRPSSGTGACEKVDPNCTCTPMDPADACKAADNAECGDVPDGCGGTVGCGACENTDPCHPVGICNAGNQCDYPLAPPGCCLSDNDCADTNLCTEDICSAGTCTNTTKICTSTLPPGTNGCQTGSPYCNPQTGDCNIPICTTPPPDGCSTGPGLCFPVGGGQCLYRSMPGCCSSGADCANFNCYGGSCINQTCYYVQSPNCIVPPPCVINPDGTVTCGDPCLLEGCSASAPTCGMTTSGIDNCGRSCTITGPLCATNYCEMTSFYDGTDSYVATVRIVSGVTGQELIGPQLMGRVTSGGCYNFRKFVEDGGWLDMCLFNGGKTGYACSRDGYCSGDPWPEGGTETRSTGTEGGCYPSNW